jgi:hypothetical protein
MSNEAKPASGCTVEGLVLLKEIHDHYESEYKHPHPDGPGHCHSKTGHWDADGRPCEWCATWNRVRSFIKQNAGVSIPGGEPGYAPGDC